jgi:uncharacterized protein with PIN domain
MSGHQVTFRIYEELNDFLPREKVKQPFTYLRCANQTVKDAIEALGIPHVEVDLILVNGQSVDFSYRLQDDDYISVYPVFETLDISPLTHLRPKPLRQPMFILDLHLGKLVKYLRMLGFDTIYRNEYTDPEIIRIAQAENRILLTRDLGLLKVKTVTHGYWIRSQQPVEQLKEVIQHFDLYGLIDPFNRCIKCNGMLEEVAKESVLNQLQPLTVRYYNEFYRCRNCGSVFWDGSHFEQMQNFVRELKF